MLGAPIPCQVINRSEPSRSSHATADGLIVGFVTDHENGPGAIVRIGSSFSRYDLTDVFARKED